MIELLQRYADDHGLAPEPGFTALSIKWALQFSADGRFLGAVRLGDASDKKDPGREFAKCPDLSTPEINSSKACHFLRESASTATLLDVPDDDERQKAKQRRFAEWFAMAKEALPGLAPLQSAFSDDACLAAIRVSLTGLRAKGTDKVTVQINGVFPLDDPAIPQWWRGWRANNLGGATARAADRAAGRLELGEDAEGEGANMAVSVASGKLVRPAATHPAIKGLGVGASPMGASVASFDKRAFQSYHLEQGANAAMSIEEAAAYKAAIERLVQTSGSPVGAARYLHWYSCNLPDEDDVIAWIGDGSPATDGAANQTSLSAGQRAQRLLRAIQTGTRADLLTAEYYLLIVSGSAARVVIRGWERGSFRALARAVERWFADLEITNHRGSAAARLPGIGRLVECCLAPMPHGSKREDWLKGATGIQSSLTTAALNEQRAIPAGCMAKATVENRTFVTTGALASAAGAVGKMTDGHAVSVLQNRMALLKAYHVRKGDRDMSPYLNEDHPSSAYQCGRLMAVYARLQHAALGDRNADVVQRFYAAASATPALVMGRLAVLSKFHLGAIKSKGLAIWFERKLADIASRVENCMPTTLSLEQQSMFALGYYQQYAADEVSKPGASSDTAATEESEETNNE